jgi:hypothetical protein
MNRMKTSAAAIASLALACGLSLSACSGGETMEEDRVVDTSVDISPTVGGDEVVNNGDIDTSK